MKDKMTVLCVKPGEKPERIEIESGLDALQRAVGGYIEAVYPYEDPVALIVNEEGKLNGLPLNRALRDEDNDIYAVNTHSCIVNAAMECLARPERSKEKLKMQRKQSEPER